MGKPNIAAVTWFPHTLDSSGSVADAVSVSSALSQLDSARGVKGAARVLDAASQRSSSRVFALKRPNKPAQISVGQENANAQYESASLPVIPANYCRSMMSAVSFAHQQHEPLTVTGAEGPSSPTALARLLDRLSALEGRLVGVQVLPMPAQTGSSVGVAELEEHLERLEMALDERDFCALQRQLGVNEIASRKQPALFAPQPLTLTDFGALFVQSSAVFLLDNMSAGDFARVEAMFAECVC